MRIGVLTNWEPEQIKKQIETGKTVNIGLELSSLYDELNFLEIKHAYNMVNVITELKINLLTLMGKIETKEGANDDTNGHLKTTGQQ